jgi:serine/threonine protein phosphatase Stp1
MMGIYGKLPSHGDFVRRGLPQSFVVPWDQWLQTVLESARESLGGEGFAAAWDAAPGWRFQLLPGVCGDAGVAGVLLPSRDSVGRRFPLTLASLAAAGLAPPARDWYDEVEMLGQAGRDRGDSIDALLAALPGDLVTTGAVPAIKPSAASWWTRDGRSWGLSALPSKSQFRTMLLQGAREQGDVRWMASAASHPGTVRTRNEDAFVDRSDIGLWAVADGAGGHEAGDVASAAVVAALAAIPTGLSAAEVLAQVRLRLDGVHADLQRRASGHAGRSPGPATTVVVLMVQGDHFACLWAGDSRAYLIRQGTMCQVTRDHSLVQEMVESGLIAPGEAEGHPQANIITRAVGSQDALQLDKVSGRLLPGDLLLLCTDGLFKAVTESDIARILATGAGPEELLEHALQASARDNITMLLVAAPAEAHLAKDREYGRMSVAHAGQRSADL